jgi:hypothetical protein
VRAVDTFSRALADLHCAVPEPNLGSHVILRVQESRSNVELDEEGETLDLEAGQLWIIKYRFVARFLQDGAVSLF